MKILITGASGFIGTALAQDFSEKGHSVVQMVRDQNKVDETHLYWNPALGELDHTKLEGFDVMINLSGERLTEDRWTDSKMRKIRESRMKSTNLLVSAISQLKNPPKLLINASAIGFYGDQENTILSEEDKKGKGFLATLCGKWEAAADEAKKYGVRVIKARFGVVFSEKGGALAQMLVPFRNGVGGMISTGRQYVSWIMLEDVIAAIHFLIEHTELDGPFNIVAPNPVTNEQMTEDLSQVLRRAAFMKMPALIARTVWGQMADEIMLSSIRVIPDRLMQAGFTFKHTNLRDSFRYELKK